MVIGPPLDICSLKIGITDPDEFKTLPNLTIENFVFALFLGFVLEISLA